MHAILSYSDMGLTAIEEEKPENIKKYFRNINTSGRRLLELLNQLLDLSKMESGRMVYNRQDLDFVKVIEHALMELDFLILAKKLEAHTQISSTVTAATFDQNRMIQVLVNLLSNAIKFSEQGKQIKIQLSDGHMPDGGRALCCRVADEGPGIPDLELKSVFDKFIQSSKTKTGAGGTGLGLAICREIIEAHGGKIWAENAKPNGAIFSFVIPQFEAHHAS